ncbi:hypothetical protein NUW58_g7193 [Xylaria curta]|uniref:Uncharacterized protein n=1 Tax=Xylaria curta TaxID=42375 RepID=A0ACC1NKK9_9PEZI|nr:hypothetical protein NUW58_g7193 [Xylaria curta]
MASAGEKTPQGGWDAAEVAKHNKTDDCWVVINNNIWDVTDWLGKHPGGQQVIFDHAGGNASGAYNGKHPPDLVYTKLGPTGASRGLLLNNNNNNNNNNNHMPAPPPGDGSDNKAPEEAGQQGVKRPAEADPTYALRMHHGWTVGDGTFEPIPQDKRRKRDVPYPSYVNHTFRSRSGLSSLQVSRNAPIKPAALDIACDHLWKCMPGEVREHLSIVPPNGPDLWGANEDNLTAMYAKMARKVYHVPVRKTPEKSEYRLYFDLKLRPWIIWPIWVEDEWGSDWITVLSFSQAPKEEPGLYNQILAYAIIDARRSPTPDATGRHPPIKNRLERIRRRLFDLWGRAGCRLEHARVLEVFCSPMPLDESSSGERCFFVVKSLINQSSHIGTGQWQDLIDWFTNGRKFNHDTTITSIQQWINPYQQRVEMTGINAWILMASMDYDARISVEAILPNTRTEIALNGKKKYVYNYDLAGPYDEPPIASHDYLLPADKNYATPPGQKKPNTFWEYTYSV